MRHIVLSIAAFAFLATCSAPSPDAQASDIWLEGEEHIGAAITEEYGLVPNDLVARPSTFRLDHFVEEWRWLIGEGDISPLMITALGDFVFKKSGGEVMMVDTASGAQIILAESQEKFEKNLSEAAMLEKVFKPTFLAELKRSGMTLGPDEVYSITRPLNLGGRYTLDNFLAIDADVHFVILGQLHSNSKDLPESAKIDRITIDD